MKIIVRNQTGSQGSVLVLTIVLAGIMGFILSSYLSLVSAQNRSVVRSQTWNATIPLIEAGIEEALAHLNENGLTNLYTEGWRNEQGFALRRRRLGDGRYTVAITPVTRPIIECTGFLPAPIAFTSSQQSQFAQVSILQNNNQTYISRTVRVTVGGGALFAKGMVAKGSIDMNGNNIATDSFDSADPNFNTAGRYDRGKRKDNGDVATNSGEANMFDAGNANIMGKVATGPGGSVSVGANGTVGSLAWVAGGNTGIEAGYFSDDMNMSFPEISPGFTGTSILRGGPVTETNVSFGTGAVTVAVLPRPLPGGAIVTNYGLITTPAYPSVVPPTGVISNLVVQTSTAYPTNAVGQILTNTLTITTNSVPNPLPASVSRVVTNHVMVTNLTLPNPLPVGSIMTNAVATSLRYPGASMPAGPPTPPPYWTPPEPGTFAGSVTNRYVDKGKAADRGWYHDYAAIQSYVYASPNYSLTFAEGYTYKTYTYSYMVPENYTYYSITATNFTVTTEQYDVILDSGDYTVSTLGGKVYVRGSARVHVTGNMSFTGQEGITIGPNGSLVMYMSGESAKIAGKGVLNKAGNAQNFTYYGLKSNKELVIQGNGQFTGVIYAPDAAFTLGGGGNDIQDFIGASVTDTVRMNGHFNFHYDEDLARRGPRSRYTLTSWNEVGPEETKILRDKEWVFMDDGGDTTGTQNVY